MNLPKKIEIAGITVNIILDGKLSEKEGALGVADYESQTITICPDTGDDIMNQTYVHEIVHYILYIMGRRKLMMDEEFVECFSQLLYQVMKQD
jgi:hypothetical protein